MLTKITKSVILLLTFFCCYMAKAEPVSIDVENLDNNNQVTIRLEVGPQRFDYRYSEELQIDEGGRFTFTRDMQEGEFYQLSIADQPDNEVCSATQLTGEYSEDTGVITINCLNRSVTLTSLQGFGNTSDNTFSTVVNARLRDTDQAVTGLNESDFDVVQDEGDADELLFSQRDGYFRHVFPLREMAPRYHWVIVFDLSNSVTAEEISSIKFRTRRFFDSIEVDDSGEIPNHIKITLNTFDEELTTLISESRDIAALKTAINSISPSNRGADQYRSIISSLAQLNTHYSLDSLETGAVIVFTDGQDDVNRSSAASVASARGNKPLHFVAVGSDVDLDDLRTMAGSDFPERLIETPDFSSVNNRLLETVAENIKHIDGSYLIMLASAAKDSDFHSVAISLADQVSCASDGLSSLSEPPCYDDYSGSYFFTSSTVSATPEVEVYGESRLEFNEQNVLRVKTLWSDSDANYGVEQTDIFNTLTLTANGNNTVLTTSIGEQNISTTVTVTDNNWNVTGENQIFSPGFIGIRDAQAGIVGDALSLVALTSDEPTFDFELSSVNFENTPTWEVTLASENEITMTQTIEGDAPQFRLTLTPGDTRLDITNTVVIADTANGLSASLTVTGNSEAFLTGFVAYLSRYGLPFNPDAETDSDNDGVSDFDEFNNGTNPLLADSDFDGISDLLEINNNLQPLSAKHQVNISFRHSCVLDDAGVNCVTHEDYPANFGIESVPELQNPTLLSSGLRFSCAVDDNGLTCWGVDSESVNSAPVLTTVSELSSRVRHSCALSNGQAYCWGEGENDLLNVPVELSNPSNLTVGEKHACVLDDDGPVCWGDNRNGQLNIPGDLTGFSEIVAGRFHTCAIASGAVNCWGATQADFGQLDVPTLINPRNLRSADNAICVDTDESLVCWGERLSFLDLDGFNDDLFQLASYAIHPNAIGICAIDLQGLKCIDDFGAAVTAQSFEFLEKRITRPRFNYGGVSNNVIALWEPESFAFNTLDTSGNLLSQTIFTSELNDIPIAGDFDGDGVVDAAVRRPGDSMWYLLNSSDSNIGSERADGIQRIRFGSQESDIPVTGDYDGDSISDIAFWRPSNGTWYIRNSSGTNLGSERGDAIQRQVFGRQTTDIPLPGDFDGDRINDLSFWRASNQTWYVKNSSESQFGSDRQDGIQRFIFDVTDDIENHQPTMADFDGDGITDMALMNSETGEWLIRQSSTLQTISIDFPQSANGVPMAADYTGDGIADLTVWASETTSVIIRDSSSENVSQFSYGTQQSIPLATIPTERLALAQNVTE